MSKGGGFDGFGISGPPDTKNKPVQQQGFGGNQQKVDFGFLSGKNNNSNNSDIGQGNKNGFGSFGQQEKPNNNNFGGFGNQNQ